MADHIGQYVHYKRQLLSWDTGCITGNFFASAPIKNAADSLNGLGEEAGSRVVPRAFEEHMLDEV